MCKESDSAAKQVFFSTCCFPFVYTSLALWCVYLLEKRYIFVSSDDCALNVFEIVLLLHVHVEWLKLKPDNLFIHGGIVNTFPCKRC